MAELVFWLSLAVPVYAYVGYPVVLLLLSQVIRRPVDKSGFSSAGAPRVSLLIPAYEEARVIEQKIRNSWSLDYPADKLEIVVACDGSPDETPRLAKATALDAPPGAPAVRVIDYPKNRGKTEVLNDTVSQLSGEIVVFSDASALLNPAALRKLVENFADARVGAVSGRYSVVEAGGVSIGKSEGSYWKYETSLKILESRIASILGAHGALHAIRKDLYPFLPSGTINDDYVIAMSVLGKGYRAVYEPTTIVREEALDITGFARRVRIMAGNIQQISYIRDLVWPLRPFPLFFFLSHKVIRLLAPFAMVAMLLANLLLLDELLFGQSVYLGLAIGQVGFYALAAAGAFWALKPKLLTLPYYFTMINTAVFAGIYHVAFGMRRMKWK